VGLEEKSLQDIQSPIGYGNLLHHVTFDLFVQMYGFLRFYNTMGVAQKSNVFSCKWTNYLHVDKR